MRKVGSMDEVYAALQAVKNKASAYCTNFFPVPNKLLARIEAGQLLLDASPDAVVFLNPDCDFWRIHFCAANPAALRRKFESLATIKTDPVVIEIIQPENQTDDLLPVIKAIGFRPYARLCRLARAGSAQPAEKSVDAGQAVYAAAADAREIHELIDDSFDRYAEQIPQKADIEIALKNRQILIVKNNQTIAGLLYFETTGASSAIRYWLVSQKFRSLSYGSVLMRNYLATHSAIRRFTLWVMADNEGALQKYRHYGYTNDGLIDQVLVNENVNHEIGN